MRLLIPFAVHRFARRTMSAFTTLKLSQPTPFVTHVQLNRPEKRNAINDAMFKELKICFDELAKNQDCRSIVISGAGKLFCAGIDLNNLMTLGQYALSPDVDVGRKSMEIREFVLAVQDSFSAMEKCRKPVIACVHGGCIGAGMAIATAADIRFCSEEAQFAIKEVVMGLAADVGTLQRMSKAVGNDSVLRELAFTGRNMSSSEALQCGFVSSILRDGETALKHSMAVAKSIAERSPIAVQGTKINLNYARDHSVDDGLNFHATWNMAMLQSEDVVKSATAQISKEKEPPQFSKL